MILSPLLLAARVSAELVPMTPLMFEKVVVLKPPPLNDVLPRLIVTAPDPGDRSRMLLAPEIPLTVSVGPRRKTTVPPLPSRVTTSILEKAERAERSKVPPPVNASVSVPDPPVRL